MVRTFLCHPFIEPKAFCDNFEPTAACFMHNDSMAISSSTGSVQIYDLKQEGHPQLYSFTTTGIPVDLKYNDSKQFLVALETRIYDYKPLKSQRDLNCQVYVYWNFHQYVKQKVPCLVQAEYTKNIRGSALSTYANKFPIIDIGVHEPVTDISVCKINHNIALSARNKVYVFVFKEIDYQQSNVDKIRLIDFFKILEVDTSFHVRTLSIANNYLAFASRQEIRVIEFFVTWGAEGEVVYQNADSATSGTADASDKSPLKSTESTDKDDSSNTLTVDDNYVVWTFNQYDAISSSSSPPPRGKRTGCSNETKCIIVKLDAVKKEAPHADGSLTAKEVIGPVEDMVGHPFAISLVDGFTDLNVKGSNYKGKVYAVTLLYRRFEANEMSTSDTVDSLHSLQWLPVFVEDVPSDESPDDVSTCTWPWSVFQFPSSFTACYLSLFFSTGVHGYIYDMTSTVKLIVSYGYTSDCTMAVHTNSFLYAVTKSGLEAYTSRLYANVVERCTTECKAGDIETKKKSVTLQEKRSETNEKSEYKGFCYDPLQHDKEFFDPHLIGASKDEEWMCGLPRYSQQSLLLPCPPTNLDFCLVGLFAVQSIQFVGASSSFIGMLIKAKEKSDTKHESNISPWSMYNLHKASICNFHDELMALVEGNESSNPTVYHQLLCEGNLMLRSELTVGNRLKDKIEFHLRSSASKIAEFLSRCDNTFDVSKICEYYSMAGITFKDAVVSYMEKESSTKKMIDILDSPKFPSKRPVNGRGMLLYLNSVLFGNYEIDIEKELGDSILKIYFESQPSMLSKVVLNSNLRVFSNDIAIKFLNKHKKTSESRGMMVDPFDYLSLAVLQMKVGNPNKAESLLGEISEDSLQKICERHEFILFDKQCKLTPLGQLVKKHFKPSFMVILVLMFDHGKLTIHNILDLFLEDHKGGNVSYNYTVCEILEKLLNDGAHKKHFHKISMFLFDQYLCHICKGAPSKSVRNSHKHVPKGNGHFVTRFPWLNSMDPFTGEPTVSEECKVNSTTSLLVRNKTESKTNCACCCCNEILLKMQSLLCSRHNRKELSSHVLNKMSELTFVGKESILLLCWPKADYAEEAVECIVRNHPKSCLQYARDMFDWKAQWQLLLQFVLTIMKNNEYEQWKHEAYLTLLKGVLLRLARAYTPAEFLTFLPNDGLASFFLPYVHECWEFYKSSALKQQFLEEHKICDDK